MRNLAKLDSYEYTLLPGVVRIDILDSSDPILVDILSEIENSNDIFYLEGEYYRFLGDYEIVNTQNNKWYLDLSVVEIMPDLVDDVLDNIKIWR